MIKSFLIHLSTNMWEDCAPESRKHLDPEIYRAEFPDHYRQMPFYIRERLWSDTIKADDGVWHRVTARLAECGGNMLLIDLGDAVRYHSHPEIAVGGAWSVRKLREELARCRDLGLEVIPKLNFSSCHDAWLHDYSRMLSTETYYRVCRDLIGEAAEIFDGPRFLHIGMDEEEFIQQNNDGRLYQVVRAGTLWWHDLAYLCDEVRSTGARPWMWADKLIDCEDAEFQANVPRDVVLSMFFYRYNEFRIPQNPETIADKLAAVRVPVFTRIDKLGYDQLPCGSNWAVDRNYEGIVDYCTREISAEHLLGFVNAPWFPTDRASEEILLDSCEHIRAAHR